MILDSLSSQQLLALTIYGESRGESIEGQIAVGCVVRNRVRTSIKTYKEVVLEPKQFSCWNIDDPNRMVLEKLAGDIVNGIVPNNSRLRQALFIATGIINDDLLDNTKGAKNYITNELYDTGKIKWASKLTPSRVIGNHVFLV